MALPYVARVPGTLIHGLSWLTSYTSTGIGGFWLIESANALSWGPLVLLSYLVRRPVVLALPAVLGLGFVGYAHATIDLAADAQNAVALIFVPVYAVPIALVAFVVSFAAFGRGSDPKRVPKRGRPTPATQALRAKSFACPECGASINFGASHCQVCEQSFSYRDHDPRDGKT
jgi:hypothetical protein